MNEPRPVPKRTQEAAARFAKHSAPNGYTGTVIRVCDECGWMEWEYSSNDFAGVRVVWRSADYNRECRQCLMVHHRAPEVFAWVMGVADSIDALIDERIADALKAERERRPG